MNAPCSHAASIKLTELPDSIAGFERLPGCWRLVGAPADVPGRGMIGCSGSSPSRHATRHARDGGHPVARSAEPGEDWSWCYLDNVAFVGSGP